MTQVQTVSRNNQHDQVFRASRALYSKQPNWVDFYREVLGLEGLVHRAFPTPTSLAEFEQSDDYAEIQQMLTQLRRNRFADSNGEEPTRVITVRLPKSMHEALRIEAYDHHTSMNKLCISKLLQRIDDEMVPTGG